MELKLNDSGSMISLDDKVFSVDFNKPLIHQVVTSYLAGGRSGTKAQKTRSEVSGGGIKPWRQKGTGRARAGSIRSPIWRAGGVTFAAKPRDFTQKVNQKMYRAALRSILSELIRAERLIAVKEITVADGKTKSFISAFGNYNLSEGLLIITETENLNLYRASRNVPLVNVIDTKAVNPVVLLRYSKVLIDEAALNTINGWLA